MLTFCPCRVITGSRPTICAYSFAFTNTAQHCKVAISLFRQQDGYQCCCVLILAFLAARAGLLPRLKLLFCYT